MDDPENVYRPIPHTNGFAHDLMPVITQENPDRIQLYQWGPFNAYAAENEKKYNTLNAISEEVFDKATYKKNVLTQRCIVPATGFFEWMDLNKVKYPHHVSTDEDVFSMAGLYNSWRDKDGVWRNSYTILTTVANPMMARIHNLKKRMPVILPRELEMDWLKRDLASDEIKSFFLPYENERMKAYTIDKKVLFTDDSNTEAALKAVEYPELTLV